MALLQSGHPQGPRSPVSPWVMRGLVIVSQNPERWHLVPRGQCEHNLALRFGDTVRELG